MGPPCGHAHLLPLISIAGEVHNHPLFTATKKTKEGETKIPGGDANLGIYMCLSELFVKGKYPDVD